MFSAALIISLVQTEANLCHVENCDYCSPSSAELCLQCASFYDLSSSGCKFSGSSNNFKISNCEVQNMEKECLTCKNGYHLSNSFCEADCFSDCICFEPFECLKDSNEKNERSLYCDSNCNYCYSGSCTGCYYGYYLSSGYCFECSDGCKDCYDYDYCYECKSSYTLKNHDCEKDSSSSSSIAGTIIGVVISIVFLIFIVICVTCCIRRRWWVKFRRNHHTPAQNLVVHQTNAVVHTPGVVINPVPAPVFYNQPNPAYPVYQPYPQNPLPPNQAPGRVIDVHNFINEVKLVILDETGKYLGQEVCLFCSTLFSREVETRVLPCGHAFHGKCAYEAVALGYYKFCPVCKTQYF